MTLSITKAVLLCSALALSACSNANKFGAGDDNVANLNGGAGAADAASDSTTAAYFQQTVGDRILFQVDQSTLDSSGQALLTEQALWLNQNAGFNAIIEGHADEQGTREYNLALGARRANAVQEYLVSQGVAGARLRTITYGKERPIEICSEESCYTQNRRAVTVLQAGLGS